MSSLIRFETPVDLFRKLNLIFYVVMGSMFLLLIIALLVQQPQRHHTAPPPNMFTEYVLVTLIIISISAAYIVYIVGSRKTDENAPLVVKIEKFYTYSFAKLLLFECAGIFGLIGYILTAVPLYLAIGFVVIMLMFLHKPSPRRLAVEFKLTKKEREVIEKNQPIG